MEWSRCRTTKLTDRQELTNENQKLQGKSPDANGGSVQRIVRRMIHIRSETATYPANAINPKMANRINPKREREPKYRK